MQRGGQYAASQRRDAAAGLDEVKFAIEADALAHTQPAVEIQQIDATAQQHMLAIVDEFGSLVRRRQRKRRCAAAQKRARFEYLYPDPRAAEGGLRRETGQSSAYDDHARHLIHNRLAEPLAWNDGLRRMPVENPGDSIEYPRQGQVGKCVLEVNQIARMRAGSAFRGCRRSRFPKPVGTRLSPPSGRFPSDSDFVI